MEYRLEVLRRLQDVECDMLKNFDRVCTEYDIQYFAIFGTAIGAMRHNGFIPWDDDIDVGIMRNDLKKLIGIDPKDWENDLLVMPDDGTSFHRLLFPRLYRKGTSFSADRNMDLIIPKVSGEKSCTPIWIDIHIYDRIPSESVIPSIAKKKIRYRKLYRAAKTNLRIDWKGSPKKLVRSVYRKGVHAILNMGRNPEVKLYEKYRNLCSNKGEYVTDFDTMTPKEMYTSFCRYDDIFPVRRIPFMDATIPVPKNVEKILTNLYGNYMELPPVEKRWNHETLLLDFGDGINQMENSK